VVNAGLYRNIRKLQACYVSLTLNNWNEPMGGKRTLSSYTVIFKRANCTDIRIWGSKVTDMCVMDIQLRITEEKFYAWVVDRKSNNIGGRLGKA
jgi:hypothetical protein